MQHDFDRIHCPHCRKMYRMSDLVYLDENYTIVHQKCYSPYVIFMVIDRGTYREILDRHESFHELIPKKGTI
ncbi:hypothetical protein [Ornithinibacillus halotolerans]|uniref:Uncharacterized protein n=1 Tax=Ornithinibacillus halotolerans TaxID=1274357 RepID=A0A916SB26_9BACI|nr:hypothetical protein [Ornithinibacillus halotolerans]GGA91614.1 hypothetical protein GCM10008025_37640 [Ornithinibacillus halotolerans]